MGRYEIRNLCPGDFNHLMQLEKEIFGDKGEKVLGPYYVRLCCEFFSESCFLASVEGEPVGYVLSFIHEREAYCTTLAVRQQYQGTRVVHRLLRALSQFLIRNADSCWFTVSPDNEVARSIHALLGARETEIRENFYGPGDRRIISRIDREVLVGLRERYERLGLVERKDDLAAEQTMEVNNVAAAAV